MRHDLVIFLGPTMDSREVRNHLDAVFLPPADQGAVFYAVEELYARIIVIIDGVFGVAPTVRHKEIGWALCRGATVYGAASMGAVRAAELFPWGMIGFGRIYRWYRATLLADDDEVAVAMAPVEIGSRALSESLINIRTTLKAAQRQGLIEPSMQRDLTDLARSTHFTERSYKKLFDDADSTLPKACRGDLENLRCWVEKNAVDQKRLDAEGLLRVLASRSDYSSLALTNVERESFILTEALLNDLLDANFDADMLKQAFSSSGKASR